MGLCLLLSVALPAGVKGSEWFARGWRTDDGLPDNIISGLAQTPDGFLWVGTQGGLMRFDGTQFEEFTPVNLSEVPNRLVRSLIMDHQGGLWMVMNRSVVVHVASNTARVFTIKDGLLDFVANSITEDGEGAIWVCYNGTNAVSRIKDGVAKRFDIGGEWQSGSLCWLATDNKHQLWFAAGNHIGVFRDGSFQTLLTLNEPSARIAGCHSGGIWIGTATRLLKYTEEGKLQEIARLPEPSEEPGILFEDHSGAVWIGSTSVSGLFRYDGKGFETVRTSPPSVNCAMEDAEGNMWVGTDGGGLNRLRPRIMELIKIGTAQSYDSVRSVCEDANGSVWAVLRGLLMRQRGTNWENVVQSSDWPGGRAECVAADNKGAIWVGTRDNGLFRFQDNHFTSWRRPDGLGGDWVRSLLTASNGDVWIGLDSPRELQRLRDGKLTTFELPASARSIRAMAEDAAGTIWMATAEGKLWRVTNEQLFSQPMNVPVRLASIRSLLAAPDGSLWIGFVGGGLGRLVHGKLSRITTANGLEDDYISQMLADDSGWLWLAGRHGFSRIKLNELIDIAEGRATRVHPIVFGPGEGLTGLQATFDNYPSAWRGRDGTLQIGTRTGLAVIHPENIRDNPNPPPVLLERVIVDGKTMAAYDSRDPIREQELTGVLDLQNPPGEADGKQLTLPPNHRKLEFEFTGLSFSAPENVQFRYRLDGFDEDWNEGGTARIAPYPRLPAGKYRFRVMACNNSGVWSTSTSEVGFTVLPFMWQTWWFRGGVIAGSALVLIAVVRFVSFRRLQKQLRLAEQQAAVERERMRIARDIHDDLGNRLTTVSILSGLALRNCGPGNGNGHSEQLQQIAATAQQATSALDEIVWTITPQNDVLPNLIDYIGEFTVEFLRTAGVRCRVDLPNQPAHRPVPADVRHNLFLAVKEALNNVVRHAGATEVLLRIMADERALQVTIEDNGKGFDNAPAAKGSDGLRNMRQRISEVGGRFLVESRPGSGTRIVIEFDWRR